MFFLKLFSVYRRSIPSKGDKDYKCLRDHTNEELISYLKNNLTTDFQILVGIMSEILRRMNDKNPLIEESEKN